MSGQKLFVVVVFIAILYNLGVALYYLYFDKGKTHRTVRALSWRIGLSIGLVLLIVLGVFLGFIEPHGVRVGYE